MNCPMHVWIKSAGTRLHPIEAAAPRWSHVPTHNWTHYWSWERPSNYRRVVSHQSRCLRKVNHISNLVIPLKPHLVDLSNFLNALGLRQLVAIRTPPASYHKGMWIQKNGGHRGVTMWRGKALPRNAILQERAHPMMIPGTRRVFDVGIYVLVHSISPLQFSVFNRWLIRICAHEYVASRLEHESHRFVVGDNYSVLSNFSVAQDDLTRCDNRSDCALWRMLQRHGSNVKLIESRIDKIIHGSLRFESRRYKRRMHLVSEFELLRFDFLLHRGDARPLLTEINLSPELRIRYTENDGMKRQLVRDVLHMVSTDAAKLGGWRHYEYL